MAYPAEDIIIRTLAAETLFDAKQWPAILFERSSSQCKHYIFQEASKLFFNGVRDPLVFKHLQVSGKLSVLLPPIYMSEEIVLLILWLR